MAKAEELETVHVLIPGTIGSTAAPVFPGRDYKMPRKMASVRYQRGTARPAAEVYMERLRSLGVVGVVAGPDAEPSVALAARKTGLACQTGRKSAPDPKE